MQIHENTESAVDAAKFTIESRKTMLAKVLIDNFDSTCYFSNLVRFSQSHQEGISLEFSRSKRFESCSVFAAGSKQRELRALLVIAPIAGISQKQYRSAVGSIASWEGNLQGSGPSENAGWSCGGRGGPDGPVDFSTVCDGFRHRFLLLRGNRDSECGAFWSDAYFAFEFVCGGSDGRLSDCKAGASGNAKR